MSWANPIQKITVKTTQRSELLDITAQVQKLVRGTPTEAGFVIVYVPHTTAGVTIQENADPDVKSDLLAKLEALIPKSESYYRHAEGNSDSHLKTALTGNSVMVLVQGQALVLGQWQGIYLAEFDGPRQREVLVKIIGGSVRNG
ncbi:MAG: secondary thiamine-phosphate synthase enzyme YjbQ [Tepidisphaeraceae bacterium]